MSENRDVRRIKIGLSQEDKINMRTEIATPINEHLNTEIARLDNTIKGLGNLEPSGTASSNEILSFNENKGIYVGTDTGEWYYWNATQNKYVSGGLYQVQNVPEITKEQLDNYVVAGIYNVIIVQGNVKLPRTLIVSKNGNQIIQYMAFDIGHQGRTTTTNFSGVPWEYHYNLLDEDGSIEAENLKDGSVTPEKTTFLENENKNLFNGILNPKNIYLQGNDSGGLGFAGSQLRGKGFAVAIKPNTTYTIIKDQVSETLESNGYYNFKYGTTSHSLEVVNSNIENRTGFDLDGSIAVNQSSNTDYFKRVFNFTSGSNDNTLIVMVGLENEPYIEVLEGTFSDFQYGTYEPKYNPKGLNIYNKDEVKVLLNDIKENKNKIICNNGVCTINFGKSSYVFQRNTKSSINLDTYMFTSGTINGNIVFSGTDIEAPIKEKNTDDFIGGVHGDEIFSNLHILVNGVEKDISTNFELEFYKLTIFVKSTLYHCNTSNECFTRYKKLEFENDKLTISNRLICLDNFIVERYTGTGLYSIYKSLLNGYSTNIDNEYYEIVGSTTESEIKSSTSKDLTEAYFYGNNYNLSIKALTNNYSEYYKGGISDFYYETKPRLKIYLDAIYSSIGLTINVGEELHASFEIKVN